MKRLLKKRLQLLFLSFFLLLAIPSLILSYNAYEKIRWQTFHQFQLTAQSLVLEIDNILMTAIQKEEARNDSDYNFLVVEGDLNSNFLQRSTLSKYPVESDFPGVIGYFQVDSTGKFSSPLLPVEPKASNLYGITPEDKLLRNQLAFNLQNILAENQLVNPSPDKNISSATGLLGNSLENDYTNESENKYESVQSPQEYFNDSSAIADSPKINIIQPPSESKNRQENLSTSAAGFSQLDSDEQQQQISEELGLERDFTKNTSQKDNYDIATLKENIYNQKVDSQKSNKAAETQRAKRKEQNYLVQQKSRTASDEEQESVDSLAASPALNEDHIEINLFESELEPFKFSLLKSGHFVAYRQVWRNDKRIIQGAIFAVDDFLTNAIKTPFDRSPLSAMSKLGITYGKSLLKTFSNESMDYRSSRRVQNSQPINGELLLSSNLSAPFSQMSLAFHITDMPNGSTGRFILIIAAILVLALVFGTYALYRLTYRQSLLAQQHQDFISSVSHELKTPITSIKMYGEILKQGWADQTKREEYYDFIYSEAERLSRLISNILQISKVSRNSLNLDIKPLTLGEISKVINSKIDTQIKQSGFNYSLVIDEGLENNQIKIDPDAFIQIIINLVDNAIKYSNKATKKQIDIVFSKNKNNILISVRDYGPGIKKDQTEKIFELFYRIGNELTRESKGTGIGLALVSELTQAMSGNIKVVNKNIGAEFILQFPAS